MAVDLNVDVVWYEDAMSGWEFKWCAARIRYLEYVM